MTARPTPRLPPRGARDEGGGGGAGVRRAAAKPRVFLVSFYHTVWADPFLLLRCRFPFRKGGRNVPAPQDPTHAGFYAPRGPPESSPGRCPSRGLSQFSSHKVPWRRQPQGATAKVSVVEPRRSINGVDIVHCPFQVPSPPPDVCPTDTRVYAGSKTFLGVGTARKAARDIAGSAGMPAGRRRQMRHDAVKDRLRVRRSEWIDAHVGTGDLVLGENASLCSQGACVFVKTSRKQSGAGVEREENSEKTVERADGDLLAGRWCRQ